MGNCKAKKAMSNSEIIDFVAEQTNLTKVNAKEFVDSFAKLIIEQLKTNNEFNVFGLGKLKVIERPERLGRNPLTGRQIKIPSKKVVRFKIGQELKNKLN